MEYRRLGKIKLHVSVLCLGTMQFGWAADEETSHAILDAFVEAGGNFIDTANVYSRWSPGRCAGKSEEIIGRWIESRGHRENIHRTGDKGSRQHVGRTNGAGLSRAHILKAAEGSLPRLKTDSIDLYQTHSTDPATPHEDIGQALSASCNNGLVRFESLQPYSTLTLRWDS